MKRFRDGAPLKPRTAKLDEGEILNIRNLGLRRENLRLALEMVERDQQAMNAALTAKYAPGGEQLGVNVDTGEITITPVKAAPTP